LIVDELPPLGKSVWLITRQGSGIRGAYHPEWGVIAWAPLPKLTPEQKRRLQAMKAEGTDPTKHQGETHDYDKTCFPFDGGDQCCPKIYDL
jgi:hypothetical protein